MNKIKTLLLAAFIVAGFGMAIAPAQVASAADCGSMKQCVQQGVDGSNPGGTKSDIGSLIKAIVSALLFIIGAVSVVMIVIGGIKYTISQGDSSAISSAKNTILYAVIGLIVALLGYAIVQFVIDRIAA